jgi:manganese/zinc/iron transport system permease protein
MGAVSLTTVASFDAVGAILVVAFLIVPPATAHLLTDRLWLTLVLAVAIGAASAVAGYVLARALGDASVAGCMAVAMGAAFAATWLLAPREGILGRFLRLRRNRRRVARALVLARLARSPAPLGSIAHDLAWPRSKTAAVCRALVDRGLAAPAGDTLAATPQGLAYAVTVTSPDKRK